MYPTPQPVPPIDPQHVSQGISYVRPLTRRGVGPGIVVMVPHETISVPGDIKDGIPSARMKWAEEGYSVIEVRPEAWENSEVNPLDQAVETFASRDECQPEEKIGLVCYDASQWQQASEYLQREKTPYVAAVIYSQSTHSSNLTSSPPTIPTLIHLSGKTQDSNFPSNIKTHEYPSQPPNFALPFHPAFNYSSESLSHSRNLSFLKPPMSGPYFDLEALWDEHTYYEFGAERSVENVMMTMVQEPYVNHIPTITGGIGRQALTTFYRERFIFSNPADSELELISRTVGIDRVVDEFVFKVTFDREIPWLFPGVPATGTYIEVPMMAVVNFRGDRLYHEHINWDSATALGQVGMLPEFASMNGMANGVNGEGENRKVKVKLPVAEGNDAVRKMRDKNAVESNGLLA